MWSRFQANNLPLKKSASDLSSKALSTERRLHHPREFRKFFGKNEVFGLSECVVYRIPNQLGHFRLGITLKARGTSIERNRVKRRIREAFRNLSAFLGGFDYNVVIPAGKKMAHPFHLKLMTSLEKELREVVIKK